MEVLQLDVVPHSLDNSRACFFLESQYVTYRVDAICERTHITTAYQYSPSSGCILKCSGCCSRCITTLIRVGLSPLLLTANPSRGAKFCAERIHYHPLSKGEIRKCRYTTYLNGIAVRILCRVSVQFNHQLSHECRELSWGYPILRSLVWYLLYTLARYAYTHRACNAPQVIVPQP